MLLLCVAGGGEAGAGAPAVGISPASAETDKTQVRINAKPILFTGVFSYLRITGILASGDTSILVLASKPVREDSLQGSGIEHYYAARSSQLFLPTHSKGSESHEDNSGEAGILSPYG